VFSGRLLTMFREDISNNFTKEAGYFYETLLKARQTAGWCILDDLSMNTKEFCLVGSNVILSSSTYRRFGVFLSDVGRFLPRYTA
jgi:hypothetical protein